METIAIVDISSTPSYTSPGLGGGKVFFSPKIGGETEGVEFA